MDWIRIKNKRYSIVTKAAELPLFQIKRISNLKRPAEFESEEGFKDYLDYIRTLLFYCSGVEPRTLERINPTMTVALFGLVSDLVTELETFNFQEYESEPTGYKLPKAVWMVCSLLMRLLRPQRYKLPKAVWMGGDYHYGYGITAKTYAEASDIVSLNSAPLLGLLPYIYTGAKELEAIEAYHNGQLKYSVAIDFFKIHLSIANRIHSKYPVLSEKGEKGETVKGYGAKGLLYEVAASGIATLKEVEAMEVLDFFDVLAYLRTVNKQIKQKYG